MRIINTWHPLERRHERRVINTWCCRRATLNLRYLSITRSLAETLVSIGSTKFHILYHWCVKTGSISVGYPYIDLYLYNLLASS